MIATEPQGMVEIRCPECSRRVSIPSWWTSFECLCGHTTRPDDPPRVVGMNEYEVDVWTGHSTDTQRVAAHSAADALTMVELQLSQVRPRTSRIESIRCVERTK